MDFDKKLVAFQTCPSEISQLLLNVFWVILIPAINGEKCATSRELGLNSSSRLGVPSDCDESVHTFEDTEWLLASGMCLMASCSVCLREQEHTFMEHFVCVSFIQIVHFLLSRLLHFQPAETIVTLNLLHFQPAETTVTLNHHSLAITGSSQKALLRQLGQAQKIKFVVSSPTPTPSPLHFLYCLWSFAQCIVVEKYPCGGKVGSCDLCCYQWVIPPPPPHLTFSQSIVLHKGSLKWHRWK